MCTVPAARRRTARRTDPHGAAPSQCARVGSEFPFYNRVGRYPYSPAAHGIRLDMNISIERVVLILGATLGAKITSLRDLRRRVEEGLPVESLDLVARHIATNDGEVGEIKHAIVPQRTLARRPRLTLESKRVERLARLTALAEYVWENEGHAHELTRATPTSSC